VVGDAVQHVADDGRQLVVGGAVVEDGLVAHAVKVQAEIARGGGRDGDEQRDAADHCRGGAAAPRRASGRTSDLASLKIIVVLYLFQFIILMLQEPLASTRFMKRSGIQRP